MRLPRRELEAVSPNELKRADLPGSELDLVQSGGRLDVAHRMPEQIDRADGSEGPTDPCRLHNVRLVDQAQLHGLTAATQGRQDDGLTLEDETGLDERRPIDRTGRASHQKVAPELLEGTERLGSGRSRVRKHGKGR